MFKKAQVMLLPTEKANSVSDLVLFDNKLRKCVAGGEFRRLLSLGGIAYSLYIINDDKIEEGDWVIVDYNFSNQGFSLIKTTSIELRDVENGQQLAFVTNNEFHEVRFCKKIISTTDNSLTINATSSGRYVKLLPQPSQQFIEAYIKAYNEGKPIVDILIEYITNETGNYREFDSCPELNYKLKLDKNNNITIRKIQDNFSKEELKAKLLELNPQINENSKYTNPHLYTDITNWYNELKNL